MINRSIKLCPKKNKKIELINFKKLKFKTQKVKSLKIWKRKICT